MGPPVGGFLYSAGGFFLPFVVMGVLTLLMGVFIYIALPSNRDGSKRTRLFSLYAYVEHVSLLSLLHFIDKNIIYLIYFLTQLRCLRLVERK